MSHSIINFTESYRLDESFDNITQLKTVDSLSGDSSFTKKCVDALKTLHSTDFALMTTSCTHSLELAALCASITPGDEIIMPSFTFVSTANAFALRGAKIKFVDIRPDTLNLNENLLEEAITPRTKAIVPVHYAGVSCEMDLIMEIAQKYELIVIEDAAQAIGSRYKDVCCGTIADFGCLSFHDTKNINCGEGGALFVNNVRFRDRAEIIREKGTNRSAFLHNLVDKYTWVDVGSSYLMSELNSAWLLPQIKYFDNLNKQRMEMWNLYHSLFLESDLLDRIKIPSIPENVLHNAHIYFIRVNKIDNRNKLIEYLRTQKIVAPFHYLPLHKTNPGVKYGEFVGKDNVTTIASDSIIRLPLHPNIKPEDVKKVFDCIKSFFNDV